MTDVLILGGGVAGLSAGIYSLMNGHSVTICEQHTIVGGNLTGWNRKGYHIDNCIHWLTGTNPNSGLYKMWEELGALGDDIKIIQSDKLYTYEKDGKNVSLWRDIDKTVDEMLAIAPEDEKRIRKFGNTVKKAMFLSGVGGENHDKGGTVFNKLDALFSIIEYNNQTVTEYGKTYKNPFLQGFFSCITGPNFSMSSYIFVAATYCSDNGGIPEGGSFSMALRLADRFKSLGGNLITGVRATKVNIENKVAKSVTFEDGKTIEADNIVITFDPKMVFGKLLDKEMPQPFRRLYSSKAFERFSSIHAAFEVDAEEIPFNGSLIVDVPEDLQKILCGDKCVLREFSHETKYSPEGRNIIQTMIYTDEINAARFVKLAKEGKGYKEAKKELRDAQMELIERTVPVLKGKIDCLDSWTPASYARYVGSEIGSFMSFQMPKKKMPSVIKSKVSGIQNVFLATQWQMAPGGLPIAAKVGKMAADAINKRKKKDK